MLGSLLLDNDLFFCMYIVYDHLMSLSTWNCLYSSGANGWKATGFGCNKGSTRNFLAVVEYDLAVYNKGTLDGIVLILYLSVGIYVYIYTVYAQPSSGALYGSTVDTVQGLVAADHRELEWINTGSTCTPR